MPIYLLDYHICALISYTNTLSYSLSVFLYSLFSFYSLKRWKKKFHIVIFIFFFHIVVIKYTTPNDKMNKMQ